MGDGDLLAIPSQYPYRWLVIKYGDSAKKAFEKKEYKDLHRALVHELLHVVMDELNTKYRRGVRDREWSDSLETTIEHLTMVIVNERTT